MAEPTRQQFLVTIHGKPKSATHIADTLKSVINPWTEGLRVVSIPERLEDTTGYAVVGQPIPCNEPAAPSAARGGER